MGYDIKNNTLEDCIKYWRNAESTHNKSKNYNTERTQERSKYLLELFKRYNFDKLYNILELGCNCGRNLNSLFEAGYKNLVGIDLNKSLIDFTKEFKFLEFPSLKAEFIYSSIEDYLLKFANSQFDIVFSMAVLQHVSLDSNWIFEHLSRITSKYLILIENDKYRDYNSILTPYGMTLIEKNKIDKVKGLNKYQCFIFEKNK